MNKFSKQQKEFLEPYLILLLEGSFCSSNSPEEFIKKIFDDIINVSDSELMRRAIKMYENWQKI